MNAADREPDRRVDAIAAGGRRRGCLAVVRACRGAASVAPAAVGKKKDNGRRAPNVVVVMSDDQTADSMRFMPHVNRPGRGRGRDVRAEASSTTRSAARRARRS